jgi:hypothetical protein
MGRATRAATVLCVVLLAGLFAYLVSAAIGNAVWPESVLVSFAAALAAGIAEWFRPPGSDGT